MDKVQTDHKMPKQALVSAAAELLGPVIEHYLRELDAHLNYLDDGKTVFLFATRAGIRIRRSYEQYLKTLQRNISGAAHLFWLSRFLACKGISARKSELAINTIGAEFSYSKLPETIAAIFRSADPPSGGRLRRYDDLSVQPLHEFIASSHPMAKELRSYLKEQAILFTEYLTSTVAGAERIVLIDSGWHGTAQRLLAEAFPEYEWMGLYFGWMAKKGVWNAALHGEARGLVFNAPGYQPRNPETALCVHRHVIESLFEPNGPSIEHLERDGESGEVCARGADRLLSEKFDETSDPLYVGVLTHLANCAPSRPGSARIHYQKSIEALARKLTMPDRDDAFLLEGKIRSADFGRDLSVPVLVRERRAGETAQSRIARSLWPEGQIAIEFERDVALRLQRRRLPQTTLTQGGDVKAPRPRANFGRVAVITRTKDRPILLKRTARSIADQRFRDFVWVVVNDGGDPDVVIEVLLNCAVPTHQIVFCSNETSLGMEAASNVGISASESEYVVIHDDDDSWHPDFLKATVEFLEGDTGKKYGGVITHSVYISEEIVGEQVVEHGRWPYHDWVQHVHLNELAVDNFFPPIAFVFRRSVAAAIDFFDEELPVLGDWDFALRFLIRADIGVVAEKLAYYHHRDRGNSGAYSNSVIGGVATHIEYNAILRNKFIRGAGNKPEWAALVTLMAQGYSIKDIRHRVSCAGRPAQALCHLPTGLTTADDYWCLLEVITARRWWWRRLMYVFLSLFGIKADLATFAALVSKTRLNPPPDFDETTYLTANPDVAAAVVKGQFGSGFEHYIKYGRVEGRSRATRATAT